MRDSFSSAASSGDGTAFLTAAASGRSRDGYGSLSRLTFQVRQRYWLDQGANGFASTDIPGEIWDATFDQPGSRSLLQAVSQCWDNDPWARGPTRLMHVGQGAVFHPHVATPEGHIHFAAEYTSTWYAWMNGAIESGSRAADEVNRA